MTTPYLQTRRTFLAVAGLGGLGVALPTPPAAAALASTAAVTGAGALAGAAPVAGA